MKTQHFLRHGLLIILLTTTTFIVQAQTPLDAYVTTTIPVNDSVVGTMFITLADTNQVDLIEIKLGSNSGVNDLFNYSFAYDQTTGLPAGYVWSRTGNKLILQLGSFAYSDVQFGSVRVKQSNGTFSDAFAFVTN
ncbi:MAG: hypothetical protein IPN36_05470 [Bacteroidetes bacterium]|nr:hypothetical protein [Bacteroidota bacterium]